jgi:hypothetical protein
MKLVSRHQCGDELRLYVRDVEGHEEHRDALVLRGVGLLLAVIITYCARCAPVENIFWPVMTHSSPSRTACLHAAASFAQSGSV